jgi:hypothetical protein
MFLVAMFGNKLWLLLSLTDAESSKEWFPVLWKTTCIFNK